MEKKYGREMLHKKGQNKLSSMLPNWQVLYSAGVEQHQSIHTNFQYQEKIQRKMKN